MNTATQVLLAYAADVRAHSHAWTQHTFTDVSDDQACSNLHRDRVVIDWEIAIRVALSTGSYAKFDRLIRALAFGHHARFAREHALAANTARQVLRDMFPQCPVTTSVF